MIWSKHKPAILAEAATLPDPPEPWPVPVSTLLLHAREPDLAVVQESMLKEKPTGGREEGGGVERTKGESRTWGREGRGASALEMI
eukprot:753700-Hanusia_phi.AAC.2